MVRRAAAWLGVSVLRSTRAGTLVWGIEAPEAATYAKHARSSHEIRCNSRRTQEGIVTYADEVTAGYKNAMELTLQDLGLSSAQLQILVYAKGSYISSNISISSLKLSNGRRESLEGLLGQVSR